MASSIVAYPVGADLLIPIARTDVVRVEIGSRLLLVVVVVVVVVIAFLALVWTLCWVDLLTWLCFFCGALVLRFWDLSRAVFCIFGAVWSQ